MRIICLATLLTTFCGGLLQADEKQTGKLSWNELPAFPADLGVAGPFCGVHNDALIVISDGSSESHSSCNS